MLMLVLAPTTHTHMQAIERQAAPKCCMVAPQCAWCGVTNVGPCSFNAHSHAGNRKTGSTQVLYSTTFSERGVMLGAARAPRKPSEFDFQAPLIIKNPHALPMYKEETQK
jgi:hypothetical protein